MNHSFVHCQVLRALVFLGRCFKKVNTKYISLFFLSLLVFLVPKEVKLLLIFLALDLLNNYIKTQISLESLDFTFVGLIALSYFGNPAVSLIFIYTSLLFRIFFNRFKSYILVKQVIITLFVFIIPVIKAYPMVLVGLFLAIIRYIIEYIVLYVSTGELEIGRIPVRISNLFTNSICLILLEPVLSLFFH